MKDHIIRYALHFKPIALPQEKETIVPPPLKVTALTETTLMCTQVHQEFIQRRTQTYQYFLEQQRNLWQQMLGLFTPNEYRQEYPGPKFSREDLEILASGKISTRFGDWFRPLDHYQRLIRMPEPPLLLADRVLGIDGEPGSFKRGTLWTATDVREDSWYLHHGRMPAGIMIESGQADLLLVSWLGWDFHNRGERVYRLLGCELTYFGELPQPGDTLIYDIHVDGQATLGSVNIFFFHYDCKINGELRLRVRQGQAGFFSDEELANSGGVLWDAQDTECDTTSPLDAPTVQCTTHYFTKKQLQNFSQGNVTACFGSGFELAQTHTRTPHISGDNMLFLDEITDFDSQGGPWKRGYLRAVQNISEEDWFFKGHFKNDPCMPGTLMLEAGLQAMACYLTALGYTLDKDGWRFEPVTQQPYQLRCRGQVRPNNKQVVYELFISSVVAGPLPTVFADLLVTVDGLKAFHTKIGLRCVPDWPLDAKHPLLRHHVEKKPVIEINGFKFDYASLLACAWGKPSTAFGESYKVFDNHRRVARLPGPPYHFISRVTQIDMELWNLKAGGKLTFEYDIDPGVWYFEKNSAPVMPFCVFLEATLQPCGWLASSLGSTLNTEEELLFRNLDGQAILSVEVLPTSGTLRTHVTCTNISRSAGMIIQSFKVESFLDKKLIYTMNTVFGFFPSSAFENQSGLPVPPQEENLLEKPSHFFVDLTKNPDNYFGDELHLPDPMLLMIDRVTGFWPDAGSKQLGQMRAEKDVDPAEWFFKAHFFQDPVQPGSLGIEAMIQLLQFYMIEQGMHHHISHPRFQPLALDKSLTWKYRGQVVPRNKMVTVMIDITQKECDQQTALAIADASLWVDGKRIYEAKNLGMRIISDSNEQWLDPNKEQWIKDHCPTYTIPALPMMSLADRIAAAAIKHFPHKKCVSLEDVKVLHWVVVDAPVRIYSEVKIQDAGMAEVILSIKEKNNLKPVAKGIVKFADEYSSPPASPEKLVSTEPVEDPYLRLFHGPTFQIVKSLKIGVQGSSAELDAATAQARLDCLNQILLDGATHGIPHDQLNRWSSDISSDQVGYPILLSQLALFGETPRSGTVQCEARFSGFHGAKQFPKFEVTLMVDRIVWAKFILVESLFPKGRLGMAEPQDRRAFLQLKQFVPGFSLSQFERGETRLDIKTFKECDWLPGTLAHVYEVSGDLKTMIEQIAIKEHLARSLHVHPSKIKSA